MDYSYFTLFLSTCYSPYITVFTCMYCNFEPLWFQKNIGTLEQKIHRSPAKLPPSNIWLATANSFKEPWKYVVPWSAESTQLKGLRIWNPRRKGLRISNPVCYYFALLACWTGHCWCQCRATFESSGHTTCHSVLDGKTWNPSGAKASYRSTPNPPKKTRWMTLSDFFSCEFFRCFLSIGLFSRYPNCSLMSSGSPFRETRKTWCI